MALNFTKYSKLYKKDGPGWFGPNWSTTSVVEVLSLKGSSKFPMEKDFSPVFALYCPIAILLPNSYRAQSHRRCDPHSPNKRRELSPPDSLAKWTEECYGFSYCLELCASSHRRRGDTDIAEEWGVGLCGFLPSVNLKGESSKIFTYVFGLIGWAYAYANKSRLWF
jgi:hypothetical protein